MPLPRIHPRERLVAEARHAISTAIIKAVESHDITHGELTMILAGEIQSWAKYQIREERHPDDPDKPGGIE